MELHLLSLPGPRSDPAPNPSYIYEICASFLQGKRRPQIVYIPDADENNRFSDFTVDHFSSLGEVIVSGADEMPLATLKGRFSDDSVFYLPGGDSHRLIHRLHQTGHFEFIREKVTSGIPYVGFSAGAVIAGATVSTSNNQSRGYTSLDTLQFLPFGVNPHFPSAESERYKRISTLLGVSRRENTAILAIEDEASLVLRGKSLIAEKPGIWHIDGRDGKVIAEPIPSGIGLRPHHP